MKSFNILIIGTGMYVCGKGTEDYGTILPAIFEWKKKANNIGKIYIAGKNPEGINTIKDKISKLERIMGVKLTAYCFPEGNRSNPNSYQEAIRKISKPACAIVVVPDNLHREVASATIEAGLHTLVVKPLVPAIKEVQELIEAQKRRKVYCAVEFHKRFDQANMKLRDTISQGLIGDPLYFLAEYSQKKSVP